MASTSAAYGGPLMPAITWRLGFRRIIFLKRLVVSLDLLVQLRDLPRKALVRKDTRLAAGAMEDPSTKLRFTAFGAAQLSWRKLAIVR